MANARLHNSLSLINLLEHSICGSQGLLKAFQQISLADYSSSELQGYLLVLEGLLEEAIACARNCKGTLQTYNDSPSST